MGLLDVYAAQAGPTSQPLIQTPSTPGERFSAEFAATMAPDRWFNLGASRQEEWQKSIDALHAATGETFLNPYADRVSNEELSRLGSKYAAQAERRQKIIDAHRSLIRESGVSADLPDPETIDQRIGDQGRALRDKAASLVDTGNGLAAFAGGALAPTPENIAGLFLPPARMTVAATVVARGFLANIGREAAYQAALQGGLTAGSEALDYAARSEIGTAPTLGEAAGNVAMGAAAGAVMGGAFHVLHAGPKALWERWNALPAPMRENAPLEVRDAMKVIEQDTIYGAANRLGLPWALHDRYQREAMDPILRGRALSADELRPADTSMTALGMILRNAPQPVDARADLPRAIERIASLSDADLEPFARQIKPSSFTALDRVNEQLRGLDERVAAIRAEAEQIGMPDVIDLDTAALINDAVENLKRTDLTRRERIAYERQRDTWLQSVDPHGALQQELERLRKDFFPEHGPALAEIADQRAKLQKDLQRARTEAQNEIDFLRGKLDRLKVKQDAPDAASTAADIGFSTPADMAKALEAADFDRLIRAVRENVPGGERPAAAPAPRAPAPKSTADGLAPEQVEAVKAAADSVMEGKSSLGDFKRAAKRELDALDLEANDARAASACVANGGGIP